MDIGLAAGFLDTFDVKTQDVSLAGPGKNSCLTIYLLDC